MTARNVLRTLLGQQNVLVKLALLDSVKAFFPQYAPKTATPRRYLEQNAFLQNSFLHEEMIFGIFVRFLQRIVYQYIYQRWLNPGGFFHFCPIFKKIHEILQTYFEKHPKLSKRQIP